MDAFKSTHTPDRQVESPICMWINHLETYLPESFDFYHFGRIEGAEKSTPLKESQFFGFQMISERSDFNATLLLAFPEGEDLSLYSEVGNVLAGRVASKANYLLSPPIFLKSEQAQRILLNSKGEIRKKGYLHQVGSKSISLESYLIVEAQKAGLDV